MKKVVIIMMATVISVFIGACGKEESSKDTINETKSTENKETATKYIEKRNFEENDTGEGKMWIDTPSGTSENGNIPYFFYDKDLQVTQLGLNTTDFDASKQTYIYIDGYLIDKYQLGTSQNSIDLKGDNLKVGTHEVIAVQYENNNPNSKRADTVKHAKYEIKK
ncbi:hypothetical protein [Listeria booriae]|uniref:hypothetical protein n=1 Tax=Listeria booriae TaxID=1552123 RepID=UPI0016253D28|nr:hypothetical protein [Listeria booriae]MBC1983044.1 hypothetical protein [Listeria booriae]